MSNSLINYVLKNHLLSAVLLILIGLIILQIKSMLVALFISFIIMAAFLPYVEFLRKKGVPKALSVLIPYIFVIALFTTIIVPLIPFFSSQIQLLFVTLPKYLNQAAGLFGVHLEPAQLNAFIGSEIGEISKNAYELTSKVFGGIFSTLMVLVLSFYLLLDHDRIKKYIAGLFGQMHQERAQITITKIEEKLGGWFRGQIVLSLFIGIITWIGLSVLGVEFALPLALIAGILEILPTIGPIIAAVPAIIVASNTGFDAALIVILFYTLLQAAENNLLVPRVMQKAVGLHPVGVIISVIVGSQLLGILGALLAVPFVSLILILFNSLNKR
jgi:predicted PurR-regulated permease PerM